MAENKTELRVQNRDRQVVAILENALNINYSKILNELWNLNFNFPATSPKAEHLKKNYYIELWEGKSRVELFRIASAKVQSGQTPTLPVFAEHVLSTLMDDIMFKIHSFGGVSSSTAEAITEILAFQEVENWVLDTCEFDRKFEYTFESENLLNALFTIPKSFNEPYRWSFDTSSYPWKISLLQIDQDQNPSSFVFSGKNLQSIEKNIDFSQLVTRIYGLGYGEGVNQLDIKSVNSGVEYLEDSEAVSEYGIIKYIFTDRRYQDPENLKARMQAILDERKDPIVSYVVKAADLFQYTEKSIDQFQIGTKIKVVDSELRENFEAFITKISKNNIDSDPSDCAIEIKNRVKDITTSQASLYEKIKIQDTYAQGATNLDSVYYDRNADGSNPMKLRFYIPEKTVRINEVSLFVEVDKFLSYVSSVSNSSPSGSTGNAAPSGTAADATVTVNNNDSGALPTSQALSGSFDTSDWGETTTTGGESLTVNGDTDNTTLSGVTGEEQPSGDHHIHSIWWAGTNDHKHTMSIGIGAHAHSINLSHHHVIATDAIKHAHSIQYVHSHTTQAHGHTVTTTAHSHTVATNPHNHALNQGIVQGSQATTLTILVDGVNSVPGTQVSRVLDITNYLAKDEEGKITRGVWHEVKITPNTQTRIRAGVSTQLFVTSRDGGDY